MMNKSVPRTSVKASLFKVRRIFVFLSACLIFCARLSADQITNTTNLADWTSDNILLYTASKTITLDDDYTIDTLIIRAGNTNAVTIDLQGHTLTVNNRIRVGHNQNQTGYLIFKNGTVITDQFDTNDDQDNFLELYKTTLTVTTQLLANGEGTTTITGTSPCAFIIPSTFDMQYAEGSDGNVLSFPGDLKPTVKSGNYTITTTGTPGPGQTVTINITSADASSNPVNFTNITYKATITGSGETYIVQGPVGAAQNITATTTRTLTNTADSNTMSITVTIPQLVAKAHGIEFALYSGNSTANLLGSPIYYTQQYNETTWTGATDNDWNKASNWTHGVPAAGMDVVIANAGTAPNLDADSNVINQITINAGATLTIDNGVALKTGIFTNNGTVTNNGTIQASGDVTTGTNFTCSSGAIVLTGTNDQTFNAGTHSYNSVTINKESGELTVNGAFTADAFSISGASSATILFNDGAIFNDDVNFTTTGAITLKGDFTTKGLTFTGPVVLGADTSITTDAGTDLVWFKNTVTGDGATGFALEINTGKTEFDKVVSNLTTLTAGVIDVKSNCSSITTSGSQTYNGKLTITSSASTVALEASAISFADDIDAGGKTLKIDTAQFNSTKTGGAASVTASTLELEGSMEFVSDATGGISLAAGSVTQSDGQNYTLTNKALLTLGAGITVNPAFANDSTGTLTLSSGKTTFTGDVDLSSGSFDNGSGTVEFGGDSDQGVTVKADGSTQFNTVNVNKDGGILTFTGSFESGAFTITAADEVAFTGSNTFGAFTITSANTVAFGGSNSFTAFTATGLGGKTISFEDGTTQTVTGDLKLSGTNATSKLSLTSTGSDFWEIECTGTAYPLQYLSVTNSHNISAAEFTATGKSTDGGGNSRWNFPEQIYVWQGGSSAWNLASNWSPASVPGEGAVVSIPKESGPYPVLTEAVDISGTSGGTITIEGDETAPGSLNLNGKSFTATSITNGGNIDLAAGTLTAETVTNGGNIDLAAGTLSAATVTNNGKLDLAGGTLNVTTVTNNKDVRLKGTETISGTMANGASSTVEYYDTGTLTSFIWDGNSGTAGSQYQNLIISKQVNSSDIVSVAGNLIINDAVNLTGKLTVTGTTQILAGSSKAVSLDNNANIFNGTVTVGDYSNTVSAGSVTLCGKKANGTAVAISEVLYAQSLTLNSSVQAAQLTVYAPLTLNASTVTTTAGQTYTDTVTLLGAAVFTAKNGSTNSTVKFQGNVSGTADDTTLTVNADTVADISGGSGKISTTSTQIYNGSVTLNYDTTFEAKNGTTLSSVTFKGDVGTAGTTQNLTVDADITIGTNNIELSAALINFTGDIDATGKTLKINTSQFNSTKTGGAASVTASTLELEGSMEFVSDAAGGISLNATSVTGSSYTLTNNALLTLAAGITVNPAVSNTGTVTCGGNATFESAYSGNGTFNAAADANKTTFNGTVNLSTGTFNDRSGTVEFGGDSDQEVTVTDGSTQFNTVNVNKDGGILTFTGGFESGAFTITAADEVAFTGSNTFTGFTATGLGGKTISFEGGTTQTVTGDLKLSGTNATSKLSLTSTGSGAWEISCNGTAAPLQYLSVTNSHNISTAEFTATGKSTDGGGNSRWNFPEQIYEWQGGSSAWNLASNWSPASVPGNGAVVSIPSGKDNYPVLTEAVDISGTSGGTITIEGDETKPGSLNLNGKSFTATSITNGGNIDLAAGTLTAETVTNGGNIDLAAGTLSAATVTNNGKLDLAGGTLNVTTVTNNKDVRLKGTETISGTMVNGNSSTVEYYDTAVAFNSFKWDGGNAEGSQYQNLIISKQVNSSDIVSVAGNLIINDAVELTGKLSVTGTTQILAGSSKAVSLDNSANIFNGTVTVGDYTNTVSAGSVTLRGKKANGTAVAISEVVYAQSLTINSSVQAAQLTVYAPLTLNASTVTTTAGQTYTDTVTLLGAAVFTAKNGSTNSTVKFQGNVSGTADGTTLTVNADTVADISGGSGKISTTSTQSYNGSVTLNYDTTFEAKNGTTLSTVTFKGNVGTAGTTQNLTVDADITIGTNNIELSAARINFTGNIDAGGKTLKLNTSQFNSTKTGEAASVTASTLELEGSMEFVSDAAGGINLTAGSVTQPDGQSYTLTNKALLTLGAGITVTPAFTNDSTGTLTLSNGNTTFNGNVDLSNGSFAHGSGTVRFNGTAQSLKTKTDGTTKFYNIAVVNPAQVSTTASYSSFIVEGTSWTNTTTANGFTADSTSQISFTNASVNISGINTFNKVVFPEDNQVIVIASDKANTFAQVEINGSGSNFAAENNLNQFTDYIKIGNSAATPSAVQAGTIIIKGTGPIVVSDNACCQKLAITVAATSTIELKGSLSTSASVTEDYSAQLTGQTIITSAASLAQISGKKLKITGNYQNDGKVNFAMPVDITGTTLNSTGAELNTSDSIVFTSTGNFTNNGSVTPGTDSEFHLKANLADTGSWAASGKIIFNGTTAQTFSPKAGTNYLYVEIAKTAGNFSAIDNTLSTQDFYITLAKDCTFTQNCILGTITLTKADNTKFEGTAEIDSFINNEEESGTITFEQNTLIKNNTDFKTKGLVTIGDEETDSFDSGISSARKNLTHTAGQTIIYGTVNGTDLTFGPLETKGEVTVNADNVILKKNISSDAAITFNSNLIADGNEGQNLDKSTTITNTALLTISDGHALKYTGTLIQNGAGKLNLGGSLLGEGAASGDATFATDLLFNGDSTRTISAYGTKKISTAGDIIIDVSPSVNPPATVTVNSGTAASGTGLYSTNLVIYSGNIVLNGKAASKDEAGDLILLGSAYSIEDTYSGAAEAYKYNQAAGQRLVNTNYTITRDAPYNAVLTVNDGAVLHAGQNFYANGLHITGNAAWTLETRKNSDGAVSFAEAYNFSVSNSTVKCWEDETTDGSSARVVADGNLTGTFGDKGNNNNWEFAAFEITSVYTVRDNVICVEFNSPLRNLHGEINGNAKEGVAAVVESFKRMSNFTYSAASYSDIYSDPDCQNRIKGDFDTETSAGSGIYRIYLKAPQTWNTDATGTSAGQDGSTDRNGNHKTCIPYLDIPRSLSTLSYIITDKWGKRLNHYSGTTRYTGVLDKTGPVLYSVRTGQELHDEYNSSSGAASQHSYDAHNFIEFRYSELVDFDGDATTNAALNATPSSVENIQVTDDFGVITGDNEDPGLLTIAGLATIENGLVYTGSNGSEDKHVNALYRKDGYSICISIAGYTNGTVTDDSGYQLKKWTGYIEKAVQPSGEVNHISTDNTYVKDKQGNNQIKYPHEASNVKPPVNSTAQGVYGKWDVSGPMFAVIRQNRDTEWVPSIFDEDYQAEAIGNNSGSGSTLDRIEFHLFDNNPVYENSPEWFTEIGWCNPGSDGIKETDLYKDYSYAADIFGGSRPFDPVATRTSGGIRYCSIYDQTGAFKYGVGSGLAHSSITHSFNTARHVYTDTSTFSGDTSLIFTGASSPRRSSFAHEGLYFALPLSDLSLDLKTSFTVSYDETNSFITDLAGNRLRSKTISTVDRIPPKIDMTVCPVGGNEIEVVFVKKLTVDSRQINYLDNSTKQRVEITESYSSLITKCFDLVKIDSSGLATPTSGSELMIDTTKPAQVSIHTNSSGSGFTHIKMKLNRTVTLDDIKELSIRVKFVEAYGEFSTDLFTLQSNSRVTFIQDENGNTIQMYTAHALSDFAVGAINPLYAYDTSLGISGDVWHKDVSDDVDVESWSVHDWNRTQTNYGTLTAKHPVEIIADVFDGTNANATPPVNMKIYLSAAPDAASVSTQVNKDFTPEVPWRIWFPDISTDVFASIAEYNNTNYLQLTGELVSDQKNNRLKFDIDEQNMALWDAGNQISFLFGLTEADGTPIKIMHAPELDINNNNTLDNTRYETSSVFSPLYALRLTDPSNFMSLDLWSFRLKNIVSQRGGITILNNVIDSVKGEKVVLKVNLEQETELTILVMTLDGNIVDYLQRGLAPAGEQYYSWDGTNRRGNPVARGMYFIRVMGKDIDETRKVLVIKE